MTKRILKPIPNGRYTAWGVSEKPSKRFEMQLGENEKDVLRINLTDWLDSGETISAVVLTASGVTATKSDSTEHTDITINNFGELIVKITTSAGRIREFRIDVVRITGIAPDQYDMAS